MIVYHGTTEKAYKKILKSNSLLRADSERSPYSRLSKNYQTTYGYVYLTTDINSAIQFANTAFIRLMDSAYHKDLYRNLFVFKLDIAKECLELDKDEIKHSSCEPETCFRYKGDIFFSGLSIMPEVTGMSFHSYQDCCDYCDNLSEATLRSIVWNKVGVTAY